MMVPKLFFQNFSDNAILQNGIEKLPTLMRKNNQINFVWLFWNLLDRALASCKGSSEASDVGELKGIFWHVLTTITEKY